MTFSSAHLLFTAKKRISKIWRLARDLHVHVLFEWKQGDEASDLQATAIVYLTVIYRHTERDEQLTSTLSPSLKNQAFMNMQIE